MLSNASPRVRADGVVNVATARARRRRNVDAKPTRGRPARAFVAASCATAGATSSSTIRQHPLLEQWLVRGSGARYGFQSVRLVLGVDYVRQCVT